MSEATATVTMARERWTEADVPGQEGRVAVVTGANSGIGFEAAAVLAERGATVVLACRNPDRAREAVARIEARGARGTVRAIQLDLASLASVRAAADELRSSFERLDLLVNNAGLMMPPHGRTADGFELQLGRTISATSRSPAWCWTGCSPRPGRGS